MTPARDARFHRQCSVDLPIGERWLHLAAVMDLHTHRIIDWPMADHLRVEGVPATLRMAVQRQKPGPGLIQHCRHCWRRGMEHGDSPARHHRACSALKTIRGDRVGLDRSRYPGCGRTACSERWCLACRRQPCRFHVGLELAPGYLHAVRDHREFACCRHGRSSPSREIDSQDEIGRTDGSAPLRAGVPRCVAGDEKVGQHLEQLGQAGPMNMWVARHSRLLVTAGDDAELALFVHSGLAQLAAPMFWPCQTNIVIQGVISGFSSK